MALINFKDLPDTSTPLNAENLNNNFNELNNILSNLKGSGTYNNVDFNDFVNTGIYYMGANNLNSPTNYCYMLVMSNNGPDLIQFAIYVTNLTIYVRSRSVGGGTVAWSEWKTLTPQ